MESLMNKEQETAELTLEERFAQIEAILKKLENDETSLEEAFNLYKSGLEQMKKADQMLDRIEKEMLVLNHNGELEEF